MVDSGISFSPSGHRRLATQIPQHSQMRGQRRPDRRLAIIRQAKLLRRFFHDGRDLAIVHMADVREEVVLDLVVESAGEPAHDGAAG